MSHPASGSGSLEDRLSLISQMLEEAVDLLRNTMTEVRQEAKEERADDELDRKRGAEQRRSDQWRSDGWPS